MNKKWFALKIEQIEKKLRTNAATGLSCKAARSRYKSDVGALYYCSKKSVGGMFAELFRDFSWVILLIVSLVSVFLEEYRMGLIILVLSLINLAFSVFIYHRSCRTKESVDGFFRPFARVIREGKLFNVDYSEVVQGDVILLDSGDVLLCDVRLVRSDRLVVRMLLDGEDAAVLEKNSADIIDARENNISNVTNMVYAGSTVISGSARAIVTDVGKYTYLGALTGGTEKIVDTSFPKSLEQLKKFFTSISFFMLLITLPACIISLLMSNIRGGKVFLSEAFLLLLSLAASVFAQKACTVYQYFYTVHLRKSVINPNPCAVRSLKVLDELGNMDYVFVLDGGVFSDGVYHFGEILDFGKILGIRLDEKRGERFDIPSLNELVYIYRSAERRSLSSGVTSSERFYNGLDGFLLSSEIDGEKIHIRCNVESYNAGEEGGEFFERIAFSDRGRSYSLNVHRVPKVISQCKCVVSGAKKISLTSEALHMIEADCVRRMVAEEELLIFTVSDGESECLAGILTFSEDVDEKACQSMVELEKRGVRVIVFAESSTDIPLPRIPKEMYRSPCVKAEDFLEKNLPVTYKFGRFSTYYGFGEAQIAELLEYAHSQGKKVAVIGFSDFAPAVLIGADLLIANSPISSTLSGYLGEEVKTTEIGGLPSSASCKQCVKENAQLIIPRPAKGRGGLSVLLRSFSLKRISDQNLGAFFRFSAAMLVLRALVTVLPMLLGNVILDARHIFFFVSFFDIPAFLLFVNNTEMRFPKEYGRLYELEFKLYIKKERKLLLQLMISVAVMFMLPLIPEMLGEQYLYEREYLFVALNWLQIAVLCRVFCQKPRAFIGCMKNLLFVICLFGAALMQLVLFVVDYLGDFMGIQRNPPVYLLLSFVPAIVFLAAGLLAALVEKKKTE